MANRPALNVILTLREKLPHGAQKRIAEETGYSTRTVYNVFQGYAWNQQVFEAGLRIAKEEKARQEQLAALEQQVANL